MDVETKVVQCAGMQNYIIMEMMLPLNGLTDTESFHRLTRDTRRIKNTTRIPHGNTFSKRGIIHQSIKGYHLYNYRSDLIDTYDLILYI